MPEQIGTEGFAVSPTLLNLLIATAILIAGVAILRSVTARFIRRTVVSPELRMKWLVQSRNGLLLLLILGLVLIWGEELRTLALSLVAIAVAFVVATKELILCVTGSILKSGARSFNLGDRIQVKDFRGDVIDQSLLATTILEVGPGKSTHQYTGRMAVIPNALFVSEPVINESFTNDYVLHTFTIPFKREDNWQEAREALLESARRHCQPYLAEARRYLNRISENRGLKHPSVDPRVTLQLPAAGEIQLLVRIPTKSAQRSYIEQNILLDVFSKNDFSAIENETDESARNERVQESEKKDKE